MKAKGVIWALVGVLLLAMSFVDFASSAQEEAAEEPSTTSEDILFRDLCFSPDGKLLAVANSTGTVELLNFPDLDVVKVLKGHAGEVHSITFSPDGRLLASGSGDKTVKLWEVETGRELGTLAGHTEWIGAVCFSSDGEIVASGARNGAIRVWDVETTKKREIRAKYAAATSGGGSKLPKVEVGSESIITSSVTFSPDNKWLASLSVGELITIWEIEPSEAEVGTDGK
jgi:WD40 repeat protein